jgi:hypothetical protein
MYGEPRATVTLATGYLEITRTRNGWHWDWFPLAGTWVLGPAHDTADGAIARGLEYVFQREVTPCTA